MIRRRFLTALVALLALAGMRPAWGAAIRRGTGGGAVAAGLFAFPDSAARLGRAYLASVPDPQRERRRVQRLGRAWQDLGPDALHGALARRVARDFAADRVVTLDGWLLSRTEARTCAWVALQEAVASRP